jgi:hypothetical protein
MKFIQTLVEVRARVIEQRARDLLHSAQKAVDRYIEEFDRTHDNIERLDTVGGDQYVISKFKSLFTLWTSHFDKPTLEYIGTEEFVRGKITIFGSLIQNNKMDISSLYQGNDDNVKKQLKRHVKDPIESTEFKLLVEATKGLISHLQHTANLVYVGFHADDYVSKILKVHEADPTEMLEKSVNTEGKDCVVNGEIYAYMRLPKK